MSEFSNTDQTAQAAHVIRAEEIDAQAQQKESGTRKLLESRAQLEKERELIRLGLCEREEAEKLPAPYEEGEWRWDPEKSVYYRYRALEVTDEEYAEICRANERLSRANAEALKYRAPKKAGRLHFLKNLLIFYPNLRQAHKIRA